MGFLSGITDSLFGDGGKKQSRSQSKENAANREFITQGFEAGREDINRLFPQAQASRLFGAQGAQNIMQGFVPQQAQAFQQGNLQAQTTAGLAPQQIQNALMGLPVDFGFLQPQEQFQPNFDFLNQPLQAPQFQQHQPQSGFGGLNQQPPFDLQFLQNKINPFGGSF